MLSDFSRRDEKGGSENGCEDAKELSPAREFRRSSGCIISSSLSYSSSETWVRCSFSYSSLSSSKSLLVREGRCDRVGETSASCPSLLSSSSSNESGSGGSVVFRGLPRFFGGCGNASAASLFGRPRLRGRFVPGGAVRLTVQ